MINENADILYNIWEDLSDYAILCSERDPETTCEEHRAIEAAMALIRHTVQGNGPNLPFEDMYKEIICWEASK